MELLYLWVEKYKTIENQGFNFSPRYYFEFNQRNLTKVERYSPENFWGSNIINITGIFGGNGSGKSTLLEILSMIKDSQEMRFDFNYFYIYKDGGEIKLIDPKELVSSMSDGIQISKKIDFKVKVVQYSDDIDSYSNYSYTNYYNLQSGYLLKRRERGNNYPFVEYAYEDFEYQIEFLSKYKDFIKKLPYEEYINSLESIKKINLKISEYNYEEEIKLEKKEIVEKKITIYERYIRNIGNLDNVKELEENFFWKRTIKNYWCLLIGAITEDIYNKRFNEIEIEKLEDGDNSLFEWLNLILKKIESEIDKYREKMGTQTRFYESSRSEGVIGGLKKLINFENIKDNTLSINREVIPYEIISKNEISILKEDFIHLNDMNHFLGSLIKFRWPVKLSAGEIKLFRFMGRLSYLANNIDSNGCWDNILILIDELDTSFHPEWKRRLIKFLCSFFSDVYTKNNFFGTTNKKIQIIITSHSPFIASDLPKDNIICLKSGKVVEKDKINTFGANIFDLYKKTFYLESTFGELSKEKIQGIANLLDKKDGKYNLDNNEFIKENYEIEESDIADFIVKKKEEIEYLIDFIGERLISVKLKNMYKTYVEEKCSDETEEDKLKRVIKEYGFSKDFIKETYGFVEGSND